MTMAAWIGLGLLLAAGASSLRAVPDPSASDAATLRAVSEVKQAIVAGHKARDRAALEKLYAADYTATDASGKVTTRKELLDGLATGPEIVEGRYGATSPWPPATAGSSTATRTDRRGCPSTTRSTSSCSSTGDGSTRRPTFRKA